jgi:hypothetical protein
LIFGPGTVTINNPLQMTLTQDPAGFTADWNWNLINGVTVTEK